MALPSILQDTTSSKVIDQDLYDSFLPSGDMLFRVKADHQSQILHIASVRTQVIRDIYNQESMQNSQDISLLKSVIYWQKRTIDFQALHAAFLLNSISEEDFELEADKFTVHQREVSAELIASVIERMDYLVGIPFDTSDYADFFKCNQENVMEGLRMLEQQHFSAMLPSSVATE